MYIFGTSFISQPIIVLQTKRKLASLRKEKQVSFAYGGAKYDVPVWICLAFLFQYELGQCLKSLPHDSTHEQKNRGGNNGTKRIHGCGNPAAKPPKSSETVRKTSLSNLHTHEATGSSPVVSTKNHLNLLIPVILFYNPQLFKALNFCRFSKTHNLTHTGKGPESTGQGQTGIFLSGPVFFAIFTASAG